MKKSYKSHTRKFATIACLVVVVMVFWEINSLINNFKIKAEVDDIATTENSNSQSETKYSVDNKNSDYTSSNENWETESDTSESSQNDSVESSEPTIKDEEIIEEVIPEYVVSLDHETCIDDFLEFDLMSKSGFNEVDDQTAITTYKGLCDELIYSKPTNSYEFIYERSAELPEMPYYVEVTGNYLLDNYVVRYQ